MAEQKLRVNILLDSDKFSSGLRKAEGSLKGFGTKVSGIGKSLATRLTLPLGIAGGAAIKMASDFEESVNKVEVAFKGASGEVKDFAKTSLEQFGIAQGTALDMAALFGDMSTSMGLSVDAAADLSTSLVGLAGDLSSFKNMNIEEVTTALNGVFTGETESLKRLGIVMTQVNLENFAMEQGIKKNIKQMTQAEKVNLRYQYVMSKTANAQGDFARTSGGAANQMRIFQESMKELGVTFGSIILPAFTKLVTKANIVLKSIKKLSPETQELIVIFAGIAAGLPVVIYGLGQVALFVGKVSGAMRVLSAIVVANPITAIATAVVALGVALIEVLHRMNPVVDRMTTFFNLIKSGGNPMTFASLQAQTMAKNLAEEAKQAKNAAEATEKFNKSIQGAQSATLEQPATQGRKKVGTVNAGLKPAGLSPLGELIKPEQVDAAIAPFKQVDDKIRAINVDISDTVASGFSNMIEGVASGSMNAGQAFGALLGILGEVATQIGKTAIKIGIGMIAIKKAFKTPATAIAAGVALVAMGAMIKSFGASFSGGGGGGVAKFANGGIVSGPTLGLVGEYTGARSNPEVIAPLDKLKGMIGDRRQNVNVGGEFRVQGQDLVLALQRADKNRNRLL